MSLNAAVLANPPAGGVPAYPCADLPKAIDLRGGTAVYRVFDRHWALLYVGTSRNPASRWRAHSRKSAWWPEAKWITFAAYGHPNVALDYERHAIKAERPKFNKRSRTGPCTTICTICPELGGA